ncbi:out at first protein isoform X3 [Zootermopsis nevadensis]|uniref:out at first protein isoform X3 n=1 Tax=Zootermopsis nevadensis TaxID=136037 RepID=UPI000B8EC5E9|nr:out at first protein isoform X3 [Zootermopsis nevadensis]
MIVRRGASCACYVGLLYFLYFIRIGNTQLLINVKNQGGDVLQETITANVSEDVVTLEFQRSDGTLITQLVDFRNDVQILKALVLGEEERGQSQYQVMCFLCHFQKGEFISSDAMSKLRQKNPGTIRTPEEDKGRENFTMDLFVNVGKSGVISRHISSLCGEAGDATYTREADIKMWASQPGASLSALLGAVTRYPSHVPLGVHHGADVASNVVEEDPATSTGRCLETVDPWTPCLCHLEMCIGNMKKPRSSAPNSDKQHKDDSSWI